MDGPREDGTSWEGHWFQVLIWTLDFFYCQIAQDLGFSISQIGMCVHLSETVVRSSEMYSTAFGDMSSRPSAQKSLSRRSPNEEWNGEKEGCSAWRRVFVFFLKDRKLEHKRCHMYAG